MRLLTTLNDSNQAFSLSKTLEKASIENIVDIETESNWGSDRYGETHFKIWVFDEDDFSKAVDIKEDFLTRGVQMEGPALPVPDFTSQKVKTEEIPLKKGTIYLKPDISPASTKQEFRLGQGVRFILFLCISLFFIQTLEMADLQPLLKTEKENASEKITSETFLYASPIYQQLLFDYPKKFQIAETWFQQEQNGAKNPAEEKALYQEFISRPAWPGIYPLLLGTEKEKSIPLTSYPLFEKISQGELWRLVSPIFLHGNLLHLLFNLFWIVILGRQIEGVLGRDKFLLLVLITSVPSNIAQYLMSGPDFIGISAVVSGFVFFIGERQKIAPNEPYLLERPTYRFLLVYIFGLAALQSLFFLLAKMHVAELSIGIANTAHLTGGAMGWLMGRLTFFGEKRQ